VPLLSEILGRRMGLIRPQTRDVVCERDLAATMDDGVALLGDRWVARGRREGPQPTVLIRTPYGRRQIAGLLFGRMLAERGLQVVLQSVRGTFGSGGEFRPFDERADGLATLRWLREQAWHAGPIATMGPSYLGLVQWALAADAGDDLAAMAIQVSASQFHDVTYAGTSLALETAASWMVVIAAQERRLAPLVMARALRGLGELLADDAPLSDLDARAAGEEVVWFRESNAIVDRRDPYWTARDYSDRVGQVSAAVQFVGGWYDILLPWMLDDVEALQAAGRPVQLIIGPWTHTAPGLIAAGHREGIAWLRAHLLGDQRLVRPAAIRLRTTGQGGGWREFERWPPPGSAPRRWHLGPGATLADAPVPADGEDGYRYDPAQPTPSLGGPTLFATHPVVDNARLEARPDVLVFTGPPLTEPLEAIGPVRAELWLTASSDFVDVFVRVCEVDRRGVSRNVTDGLISLAPADGERDAGGVWHVDLALWPIGHRFAAGHRIRVLVASGAHPRYLRNPGTEVDRIAAGPDDRRAVDVRVLWGPDRPSGVTLPQLV
jgi:putative CocE/NonD family hydrolase